MARRDEHGFNYLVDRKSNMIISWRRERLSVVRSKTCSVAIRASRTSPLSAFPDEKWGEAVHAVIVLHDGAMR